jgi:YidC/Oxa1 family membrane protein insertase
MDRNTIIGFVLIGLVFVAWMFWSSHDSRNTPPSQDRTKFKATQSNQDDNGNSVTAPENQPSALVDSGALGRWFAGHDSRDERGFTVETDKFIVEFSTRGGTIKRWTLKGYKTWNGQSLQLIDRRQGNDYNLLFASMDGRLISTADLQFDFGEIRPSSTVVLKNTDSLILNAILRLQGDSIAIIRRYVLRAGQYSVDMEIEMRNMRDVIANAEYQVTVSSPQLTERNTIDEASFSEAMASVGSEIIRIEKPDDGTGSKENMVGDAHWVAVHNKYFINALINTSPSPTSGAYLEGSRRRLPHAGEKEDYQASMKVQYRGVRDETRFFRILMAPMEYDLLKSQHEGLQSSLRLGWAWIVKPISEYFIIPLFKLLHRFIPNYGLVIIVFSLLIKLLLHPLTRTSMKSMQRMQKLQPLMTEVREKFKDDQQRQNVEIMKLYKDYGVNPAGGCLPMLLQMPILFALFAIFQSTIDLRQQPFVSWISDLAAPDVLVELPFKIPLIGMSFISGLALLMAITMYFQQKQSVQDPRQKSMVYTMPIMFWFLFNGFPSGLNLYYFMFNLSSILQQYIVNRRHKDEPLERVARKDTKKMSWSERMLASVQDQAKQKQKGYEKR